MFKKRVLKKSNPKRVRDEDDDITKDKVQDPIVDVKKVDKTDKEDTENKTSSDKLDDETPESNKEDTFKPDTEIEEQYHQLEKNKKLISDSKVVQERDSDGDKLYTGRISHKSRRDELVKPQSAHIKQNFIMDYQQDVCKDFLKNGYCGFGDTCKFLHVREEFKKVEKPEPKDWEAAAKRRKKF